MNDSNNLQSEESLRPGTPLSKSTAYSQVVQIGGEKGDRNFVAET
ncbi:hypothetical protein [Leptothermofonsia sp. ETS-13]